ncbi:kinase-like protein [Penicillium sp. IBT 16267x]|nr:kinase-like protein [Penicillium sp. IBT 16267x]
MPASDELFEYTSGRWIYNESLRLCERRRVFNVPELKRLAALSVQQREDDVTGFEKLAEGGFNRCFLVTMRNGIRVVARIPYPATEPKSLVIASEVATMDFLRSHGIPVPKIFGYSTTESNSAGTEYIFMEFVRGTNLGDIWFTLTEKQRAKLMTSLVQLESQIFALRFPASGSIFYCRDLPEENRRVILPSQSSNNDNGFCIGPATSLGLWYGKRSMLSVDRGPYGDCLSALTTGAKKEIAYLTRFGRVLQPFQRLRREIYDYEPQSHWEHITTLENYLQIAPHLVPHKSPALRRPVIRHSDLQPNNIFVSDDLEVCGLIDWQHSVILPLFLQSGIPKSFQSYRDEISESLQTPSLPDNFDDLEEMEQYQQADIYRRRQLHYLYV